MKALTFISRYSSSEASKLCISFGFAGLFKQQYFEFPVWANLNYLKLAS